MRLQRCHHSIVSSVILATILLGLLWSCGEDTSPTNDPLADSRSPSVLLTNARVYTFDWPAPDGAGQPASAAPNQSGTWTPDAEAILVQDGKIAWLGTTEEARQQTTSDTNVIDLAGATVLPGLVDSHTHVRELGAKLRRVDLQGVTTEDQVIERLKPAVANASSGSWIIGWGWDEGQWASAYPTWDQLSAAYPDHPVALYSLHGFAVWANRAAFSAANIDVSTAAPTGGEIVRTKDGENTGILLNRATTLLHDAVPAPTPRQIEQDILAGLEEMARAGYVAIHEAGLDAETLAAYQRLQTNQALDLRIYAMLSARDSELMKQWISIRSQLFA